MALPSASGVPQQSGILIPEIWSGRLQVKFYSASTYAAISNTDYEKEIQQYGDKVEIRTTPDIVVKDYVKGGKLDYDNPQPGKVELLIDKGKSFSFAVNDVDKAQSDIAYVEDWSEDGAEQIRIQVDRDINADIFASADSSNTGLTAGKISENINLGVTGTPLRLSKTNIIDVLVDLGVVLDEQDVPENNRWVLLPPAVVGLIKTSDLKDASLAGDEKSILRSAGRVGMIDRLTIYMTNLLNRVTDGSDTVTNMLFGQRHALTFAGQIVEMEQIRDPDDFGDLVRSLFIYGYEVIKPEALGNLYALKA